MNIKVLDAYLLQCRVWNVKPTLIGLRVFWEFEQDNESEEYHILDENYDYIDY